MNQVNKTNFLNSLTQKGREEVKQDIAELKTRIWERVKLPPVSGSQKSNYGDGVTKSL